MSKIDLKVCCKKWITIISINKAEIFYLDVLAYYSLVIRCLFHYNHQMDHRKTNSFLFEIAGRHKLLQSKYPMLPKMTILNIWNKTIRVRNSTKMMHKIFSAMIVLILLAMNAYKKQNLNKNCTIQQSGNILPGCSCILQSCNSLLDPRQSSNGSPQDEQFLVRDCWPPQAVAEQVPHAPQNDHTRFMKQTIYVRNSTKMI